MKKFSKILCLALSFILVFTFVTPAFAADTTEEYPVIFIPGIATSRIYTDKDDPSTMIPAPSAEIILGLVEESLVPALVLFSIDRDTEKLASTVSQAINTTFADWFNNPDGSAKGNAGARHINPDKSSVVAGGMYRFDYDWRGNPVDIADQLADFVDYLTDECGFEKVAIASHSLGNVITLSYISEYGNSKLHGVVFDSPAIDGIEYVGDLFCGEMVITAEAIDCLLKQILGATEYAELMSSIADVFALAGIPEMLSVFLNDIIAELAPTIFKETLVPLCAGWPTIWAMCPDERIDEAMDSVFNGYAKDEDLSALRSKVEDYNTNVRAQKHQTLLDFDVNGRVAVLSRYGSPSLPITPSWDSMGDGVIDTSRTSFGATTAPFGEVFDEAYLEGKDASFISPDRTVDASTCLFPEKTWFIKNLSHQETADTEVYYNSLLFSDTESTVYNHQLSRFSIFNAENDNIVVDNSEPAPEKPEKLSPLQVLFNFIKALFNKFLDLFRK